MGRQPTILRRGAQTGLLHWAATFFKGRPKTPVPILARAEHHRGPQRLLDDVAALIRKTW